MGKKSSVALVTVMLLIARSIVYAWGFGRYICDDYGMDERCSGESINITGMTRDWYTEMKSQSGGWPMIEAINHARRHWLVDKDKVTWGYDHVFIEDSDIALVGGHGGTRSKLIYEYYLRMNRYSENGCRVYPRIYMRLGEDFDDIEILHMVSCSSMTRDNNIYLNTWRPVFGGIHQVDGFHGRTYASSDLQDDYYRLARDGFSSAVAVEWVNELYEDNFFGGYGNCPAVLTGCNNSTDCSNILYSEQYDTRDSYPDIADPTIWVRMYVSGCAPYGANPEP